MVVTGAGLTERTNLPVEVELAVCVFLEQLPGTLERDSVVFYVLGSGELSYMTE